MLMGMQALIANYATVFLVEGFAALSFAILLRNIDTNKLNRAIAVGLCGFITAWMLAGVIAFAVTGVLAVAAANVRSSLSSPADMLRLLTEAARTVDRAGRSQHLHPARHRGSGYAGGLAASDAARSEGYMFHLVRSLHPVVSVETPKPLLSYY